MIEKLLFNLIKAKQDRDRAQLILDYLNKYHCQILDHDLVNTIKSDCQELIDNSPKRLNIKQFKQLDNSSFVQLMKKDGFFICRNKKDGNCIYCQQHLPQGTYTLWKKGFGIICINDCQLMDENDE